MVLRTAHIVYRMVEYRIDDLAREAGVSVRNVRVYQDRGLLPPPRKEGRTGWYNDGHRARLGLIGRMLDRGYTFATISELLTAAQYGLRVEDVLGTENSERPVLSREDLETMFGGEMSDEDFARGLTIGAVTAVDGAYRVEKPLLLDAARILHGVGIPLAYTFDKTEKVQADLDDVARTFVALVTDRYLVDGQDLFRLDEDVLTEAVELINTLRPVAHRAVNALFAEAMQANITLAMEKIVGKASGEVIADGSGQIEAQ